MLCRLCREVGARNARRSCQSDLRSARDQAFIASRRAFDDAWGFHRHLGPPEARPPTAWRLTLCPIAPNWRDRPAGAGRTTADEHRPRLDPRRCRRRLKPDRGAQGEDDHPRSSVSDRRPLMRAAGSQRDSHSASRQNLCGSSESSRKHGPEKFPSARRQGGVGVDEMGTDDRRYFGVFGLRSAYGVEIHRMTRP